MLVSTFQGDPGEEFYVVDSGVPEVYVKKDGAEVKVLTYGEGDAFGELALMYNAPRAATVKANGAVKVWALDRLTFKVILMDTTMKKRNVYKGFLEQVDLLKSLSECVPLVDVAWPRVCRKPHSPARHSTQV